LQQNFIGFLSLFITAPATILFSFFTIAFQNPSSKNILHPDDKHIDSTPFILSGLAIIGFFLLLILVLVPIILPKVKKMQKSFEILNSNAIEITTGLKTILSFDAFLFHKNKIFDNCKTLKKSNVYLSGINLIYPALNLFSFIFSISIYLIGGIL
jgi:ABC-type multidrug transport system fused ATPase/permease subunit